MLHRIAEVVVDIRTRDLDKTFDYAVPAELQSSLVVGMRVYVSFGRQFLLGFVVGIKDVTELSPRIKPILSVLDETPVLTSEHIQLMEWMQRRYLCTRVEALSVMMPNAFKIHKVETFTVGDGIVSNGRPTHEREILEYLKKPKTRQQLTRRFGGDVFLRIEPLMQTGAIERVTDVRDQVRAKKTHYLEPTCELGDLMEEASRRRKRSPKQSSILDALVERERVPLSDLGIPTSDSALRRLLEDELVRLFEVEEYRSPDSAILKEERQERTLTKLQQKAVDAIWEAVSREKGERVLLHGVTGSGKTEVYIQSIAKCLEAGEGSIVLVPEIGLTPQMVGRFVAAFGPRVAVLHSGLSQGEKRDEWSRVQRGEAQIVVGARSAIFAPVQNLKLVIIDEEHEPSYKQEDSPRYDAREVASRRVEALHGAVVYGSATPSLERLHEVELGVTKLVSLPFRVNGRPLPPVEIVDMREELRDGNRTIFSRALGEGLVEAVSSGGQAILFLNRRGFSSFLLCRSCGETQECPNCDIALTLHKRGAVQSLVCHYCNYECAVPSACMSCNEPALRPFGIGTQQVETAIQEQWPSIRVLRMDVDTTRKKGAHRDIMERFLAGEADVLLGTQMIAKGLDFPNVTFVGVITADTMLALPDYRAAERTFHLLTQVAGRAGRAQVPGRTVIQTYRPEHYAIEAAAQHDFGRFYRQETELRKTFWYPPYCEIAVFTAIHTDERLASGAARRFEREMKRKSDDSLKVLTAVPAGVARVENKYRYQVVVKYSQWEEVRECFVHAFQTVYDKMREFDGVCTLDVNAGRI